MKCRHAQQSCKKFTNLICMALFSAAFCWALCHHHSLDVRDSFKYFNKKLIIIKSICIFDFLLKYKTILHLLTI